MSQVELTTLGESCEFFNGKAHEKDIDVDGKYIVVNSKFISQEGRVIKRTKEQMFPLYKGDIVMVMSDVPNGKALAKCFIIDQDETYSLNQRICCIRSKDFDTKYLYYQLNHNQHFLAFNNGENQTNLRKGDILDCPLIKPSLEEQKLIVAELEISFSSLDQAIANTEKNYENANALFESHLQGVFENNDNHWEEKELGDVCLKTNNIKWSDSKGCNYHYIDLSAVSRDDLTVMETVQVNDSNAPSRAKKKVNVGDVIFATTRPTLKRLTIISGIYDNQICSTGFTVLRPNTVKVISSFVFYSLLQQRFMDRMENLQRGASYPAVTDSDVKGFVIPIPSIHEQQNITYKLDILRDESKKLETFYQRKIDTLEELKKVLLQKAFQRALETEKELAV